MSVIKPLSYIITENF